MPKKDKTRKTSSARGPYRHFDGRSKFAREKLIQGYAERYLDNVEKNNGRCKYGFMGDLVREASSLTDVLQITRKDIGHEASRILAKRREVSLESSGTLEASTMIDGPLYTSWGDALQASFGLHLLAHAAAEPHQLPFAGGAVKSTDPYVNQNCCSYPNCCVTLLPSICCTMSCTGKVHQYCSYTHQSPDSNVLSSLNKLQCWKCTNPESQANPPTPDETTTTMDPLVVDDNVDVCDTLPCSIVPTYPDLNGEFFECAAGVLCKARHPNNIFGTHMSWCCNKMIHSHVTCGMQLDDYIHCMSRV